jgi:membrane-associated protease RseP (regulator of RpoE activity)
MAEKKTGNTGIVIVFVKIIAKLLPKLMKVAKGLFGLKAIGVAASVGLYSYLLTWQMGVALVVFLAWHEYGHLYAMKKCGIATKGMYLIPGFGAVALAAEGFKSGRNEAYIALLGPVFGLAMIIATLVLFFVTGNSLFAAMAGLMTFINFINLFPINPLDGGRVIKALAYSFKESYGFIFMMLSLILSAVLGYAWNWSLLTFVGIIGFYEVLCDYGLSAHLKLLSMTIGRIFLGWMFVTILIWNPTSWLGISIGVLSVLLIAVLFWSDSQNIKEKYKRNYLLYPALVVYEAYLGIKILFSLNAASLHRIDGHVQMNRKEVWLYGILYLVIVSGHIALMYGISLLPGMGELAEFMS